MFIFKTVLYIKFKVTFRITCFQKYQVISVRLKFLYLVYCSLLLTSQLLGISQNLNGNELFLLLLLVFPFNQGWPQCIIFLQTVLFSTSVSFAPIYLISSFTRSKNLLFGLPLFLFPGNSISIIFLPTYSWSLLMTCPYHLSLLSLIFIPNHSTLTAPLMYSFLILSFLITPIANLNIFISATSISYTCFFVTTTISSPYSIVGLTTNCTLFLLL